MVKFPPAGANRSSISDHVEAKPRLVGAKVKRVEDPRLLTGNGTYVDDLNPAGTLHVAFRRSEHSHARIVSITVDAARAMPGVVGVVTGADLATVIAPLRATSRTKTYQATSMYPLAVEKVRLWATGRRGARQNRCWRKTRVQLSIEFEQLPIVIDRKSRPSRCAAPP
jgi:carbon-monoxide dehydrogenase large subunit